MNALSRHVVIVTTACEDGRVSVSPPQEISKRGMGYYTYVEYLCQIIPLYNEVAKHLSVSLVRHR